MTHERVILAFAASSVSFVLEISSLSVFQFSVTAFGFVEQPLSHTMSCQSVFSGAMEELKSCQKRYDKSSNFAFLSLEAQQIYLIQTLLSAFYQCKSQIHTVSWSLERIYTTF